MNKKAIRFAIAEKLLELSKNDEKIIVVTSDSRGSAAVSDFFANFPERAVEVGIAEQSAIGIAAGLALSGKKPWVFGPACFYSARSLEQIKNDVAYTGANVKIVGVSGGVSYGPLGSTHHTLHDIAVMRAIPNLWVILPSDAVSAAIITEKLVKLNQPVYIRVGRNPVPIIHTVADELEIGKASVLREGKDVSIVATGEVAWRALEAAKLLDKEGVSAQVIEMHTIKPLDYETVFQAARKTGRIVTIEEHSIFGGLGSAIAEFVSQTIPIPLRILGIPDEYPVTGTQEDVLRHYKLDPIDLCKAILEWLKGGETCVYLNN